MKYIILMSSKKRNKAGDVGRKLLLLQELILSEESLIRKTEKLNELLLVIHSLSNPPNHAQKSITILLYGGKGLEPLHALLKSELLPDQFKKLLVDCLALLANLSETTPHSGFCCGNYFLLEVWRSMFVGFWTTLINAQ
jgi:hypothetical protein